MVRLAEGVSMIIAERISARLLIRDLFEQCTYVRTYVCMYVRGVTFRNHDVRTYVRTCPSRLGMSR